MVAGQVASGSRAVDLGIQPSDVVVSVDQKPVTTPESAATQSKEAAAQGNVLLRLDRHGMSQFVGLSVENNGTAGSSRRVRDDNSAGVATAFDKEGGIRPPRQALADF